MKDMKDEELLKAIVDFEVLAGVLASLAYFKASNVDIDAMRKLWTVGPPLNDPELVKDTIVVLNFIENIMIHFDETNYMDRVAEYMKRMEQDDESKDI